MNRNPTVLFALKLSLLLRISLSLNAGFSQGVNISQVYGGGGSSGSAYQNDFVELFNSGSTAVVINGWSVQYANATGSAWSSANLSGSIQPYHYYLVQLAAGAPGNALPTPDATGTINMSTTSGKVALCSNATALTGSNPSGSLVVIDFIGYGTANAFKGSGPATGAGNNTSLLRKGNGFINTGDNADDFITATPPVPRNSASPANPPLLAAAPVLTLPAYAANQFSFTLAGTTGSNYVVQVSTNLSINNWASIYTNAAPFNYTQSANAFPQQFYRGMVAP